jgi:hypothetical protein
MGESLPRPRNHGACLSGQPRQKENGRQTQDLNATLDAVCSALSACDHATTRLRLRAAPAIANARGCRQERPGCPASRRPLHLAAEQRSVEIASMAKSTSNVGKKTGRGRPRLNATPITFRVLPNLIKAIDSWRKDQPDQPIRTEAIRRLVAYALDHQANTGPKRSRRSG